MTTPGSNAIKIEQQPNVDIKRPEPAAGDGAGEETMEQYATRREAEMRGDKPPEVVKQAVPADEAKPAAATEKSAAATDESKPGEKKPAESATEDDTVKLIEEAHPAKKGISKRMGELAQARKDAEAATETAKQEAADAKAEAARLAAELETARRAAEEKPAPFVPAVEEDPVPSRDNFDDPDEYQAAYTAHAARNEIRKSNEAGEAKARARRDEEAKTAETQRQARVQEQIVVLHKTFNERVEAAKPDYPDYDVKVTNNEKLVLRNDIFFTVEQSEMAPHILYHLADHPDEAASLNNMPPIQAAMRIGEIQAELRITRKPKPSKAADPITPVRHRSSPERKTPDEETMDEYAARREREDREQREASRRRAH